MIAIIGMGAVGTYLAYTLLDSGQKVVSLDYRYTSSELLTSEIHQDQDFSSITYERICSLYPETKLIIVCCKNMNIEHKLINKLIDTGLPTLFIQNGVSKFSQLTLISQEFYFGTLSGIELRHENKVLISVPSNPCLSYYSQRPDLISLFESLSGTTLLFQNASSPYDPLTKKFPRWFISSALMMISKGPIGVAKSRVPLEEIHEACQEISTYIDLLFGIRINANEIIEEVFRLPESLTTSAFRDYKDNKSNEWAIEWAAAVETLSSKNLSNRTLRIWGDRILNV